MLGSPRPGRHHALKVLGQRHGTRDAVDDVFTCHRRMHEADLNTINAGMPNQMLLSVSPRPHRNPAHHHRVEITGMVSRISPCCPSRSRAGCDDQDRHHHQQRRRAAVFTHSASSAGICDTTASVVLSWSAPSEHQEDHRGGLRGAERRVEQAAPSHAADHRQHAAGGGVDGRGFGRLAHRRRCR